MTPPIRSKQQGNLIMVYDVKKQFKMLYQPPATPHIVTVPEMNFLAVRGQGDPNVPAGEYQQALEMLYTVAYTIRMSAKAGVALPGFTEYVVPPLEGFWWQPGLDGFDLQRKDTFQWISVIRLPEFATVETVQWAKEAAAAKKKRSFDPVEFYPLTEGLCVQMLHQGPYDAEPASVAAMDSFAVAEGYQLDFSAQRHHHEIYLSDPRRTKPEKLKAVLRHPVRLA